MIFLFFAAVLALVAVLSNSPTLSPTYSYTRMLTLTSHSQSQSHCRFLSLSLSHSLILSLGSSFVSGHLCFIACFPVSNLVTDQSPWAMLRKREKKRRPKPKESQDVTRRIRWITFRSIDRCRTLGRTWCLRRISVLKANLSFTRSF